MADAKNPILYIIYSRLVFTTKYKIAKMTVPVKMYMEVASAAGKFFKQLATYYKNIGLDMYTFTNSIMDIVKNVDRFNQQIQECIAQTSQVTKKAEQRVPARASRTRRP